jgi:hypothetical protein
MVALPHMPDLTVTAANSAMEDQAQGRAPRSYLGMSQIGAECERKLWYGYHDPLPEYLNAAALMRIADGHACERILADRLRLVDGVTLRTENEKTGEQFEINDLDGMFAGHMDGLIVGLVDAPNEWHIWEAKAVNEDKYNKFLKLRCENPKETLQKWDNTYYAQAQAYMGYSGIPHHYLTVCSPGAREWDAVCTDFDQSAFDTIRNRAERIINASAPLARLSNDPNWHVCKWCHYKERCHGTARVSAGSNRRDLQILP